jgi:hypothetical protein
MSNLLLESVVIVEERAQYVVLDVNNINIGILNIYAPIESRARVGFWRTLADYNYPDAH